MASTEAVIGHGRSFIEPGRAPILKAAATTVDPVPVTAALRADTVAREATPKASGPAPVRSALASRWGAALALLAVLCIVGLARDSRGFLSSDVSPKLVTVERMVSHHTWDADVGYWAQAADPDASLHPFAVDFTFRVGDRRIVSWTVLDLLVLVPLYALGGLRLAMLLPAVSVVATALAGRALAERLRDRSSTRNVGAQAFWAIGLGTPMLVYGLDVWEHAPAVALCALALVLLHDTAFPTSAGGGTLALRAIAARALGAGALFGLGGRAAYRRVALRRRGDVRRRVW